MVFVSVLFQNIRNILKNFIGRSNEEISFFLLFLLFPCLSSDLSKLSLVSHHGYQKIPFVQIASVLIAG